MNDNLLYLSEECQKKAFEKGLSVTLAIAGWIVEVKPIRKL